MQPVARDCLPPSRLETRGHSCTTLACCHWRATDGTAELWHQNTETRSRSTLRWASNSRLGARHNLRQTGRCQSRRQQCWVNRRDLLVALPSKKRIGAQCVVPLLWSASSVAFPWPCLVGGQRSDACDGDHSAQLAAPRAQVNTSAISRARLRGSNSDSTRLLVPGSIWPTPPPIQTNACRVPASCSRPQRVPYPQSRPSPSPSVPRAQPSPGAPLPRRPAG